jgi:hypothetical protein
MHESPWQVDGFADADPHGLVDGKRAFWRR